MSFHSSLQSKIHSLPDLLRFINSQKVYGKKVAFTNGCFDILHAGHVDYLSQARDLADILVLGLNTDASVKRQNKGAERPINSQEARAFTLLFHGKHSQFKLEKKKQKTNFQNGQEL